MDTSKIIKGVVSNGRYTVTAPIVKEDYGLCLQIEGVELPETYQVDFSNSENSGTSVTMIGNAGGVRIPRQFIDTGKDIFAFLYWVGEDYGKTVYKFRIPNKVRPDRTNEEPTPEEQSVIDQAIAALNDAVAQTAQDVIDADASAQNASADAERAEEARTDAQNYATQAEQARDDAQTYANNASASATASAQSASQSAQIKADVEDLADDAQASASASAQSATASANSASQAQGYSQSASASAQSASGYASQADISANTASNKASEASTSAQTASNKASEASQSASQALTYKNDAEQAKTDSQTAQGLAEQARDTAVQAKTDAESAKADAESARDEAQQAVASISGALADKAPVITDTASGSIASFPDGADDLPLKSLVVDINPVQDLSHGDPSPENLCPISGWTEVGVEQRGKNLFDIESIVVGGISNINGGNISDASQRRTPYLYLKAGTYTVSRALATNWWKVYSYKTDENKTPVGWVFNKQSSKSETFTLADNMFVRIAFDYAPTSADNIQLELSSTANTFEPYTGRSITINLGQAVYGGKLDVLSGELVIDRAMVDLGTLNWTYRASNLSMESTLPNVKSGTNIPAICSAYKNNTTATGWASLVNGEFTIRNGTLRIRDEAYSDATAFKSAVTGQTLVYELAEPITIQLTPNQVNSLLGVNNLWADSGDTTCVYRADTKAYIAKKIAEAISALS